MTEAALYEATGINGTLRLWRDRVVIAKKGWPYGTKSEKTVPLKSIGALQWKDPAMTSGFLQIAYSGASESKGGVFDAAKDENTIMFLKKNVPEFRVIHDTIRQLQNAPVSSVAAPAILSGSLSDELEKLVSLRDRGVLTDDEFQHQKRKLLGS